MTQTMAQTQTTQFNIFSALFYSLLTILFVGILMYIFFVYTATMTVVHRKLLEKQIVTTTIRASKLEHNYMELLTLVTPSLAQSLDFIESQNIMFAQYDTRQDLAKIDH